MRRIFVGVLFLFGAFVTAAYTQGNTDPEPTYTFRKLENGVNPMMSNGSPLCEDRFMGNCWGYQLIEQAEGQVDRQVGYFARRWDNSLINVPGYFSRCMNAQAFFALIVDVILANNPTLTRDVFCAVSYPKKLSGDDGFTNYFSIIANVKGTGHGQLAQLAAPLDQTSAAMASVCTDLILGFQNLVDTCDVKSESQNNALWVPWFLGGLAMVGAMSVLLCTVNPELGYKACIFSVYCLEYITALGRSTTR